VPHDSALAALLEDGRRAWPALAFDPELFLRAASAFAPERLDKLHAADLYLACACAAGAPGAANALEQQCFSVVPSALASLDRSPDFADEVRQGLRERLFLARGAQPPGVASYSGAGPLAAWVRVCARRVALNLLAARRPAPLEDDDLLDLAAPETSPELRILKDTFAAELKSALHGALEALPVRDRVMLRMYYVEGVSTVRIGAIYGVHQSGISRTLSAAREKLLAETRRLMAEKLRITPAELESLVGMVMSRLDLSLARALGGQAPG
jgi:RNA polymerase sigma-70 factor (ECF subfamily)